MRSDLAIAFTLLAVCSWSGEVTGAGGKKSRSKKKVDRAYRDRKYECEEGPCAEFHPDENANCVHACASPACYEKIYAAEPLEDGEVDLSRSRSFLSCFREELRSALANNNGKQQAGTDVRKGDGGYDLQAEEKPTTAPSSATSDDVMELLTEEELIALG